MIVALGCAHQRFSTPRTTPSRPATSAEIVELKQVFAKYMGSVNASTKEVLLSWDLPPLETVEELREAALQAKNTRFKRYAIQRLTFHDDEATQAVLTQVLTKEEEVYERFYAACALAYQGRSDGLAVLQEAVSNPWPFSSSGFEVSEAGICLAILGFTLPPSFTDRSNAMFLMLDRLFE